MSVFSNELSNAELERLAILSEELGEAQQIIGKIIRHGYKSYNPTIENSPTNRQFLEKELGDVEMALDMMCNRHDLNYENIVKHKAEKREKIKQYLHHQ